MKRWVHSSTELSGPDLEKQIEKLLNAENIPYDFVECISDDDEDEIIVLAVTYGDWKHDNDRAHELIVNKFNPDRDDWSEMDVDFEDYGLSQGSDSCVVRHEFVWER